MESESAIQDHLASLVEQRERTRAAVAGGNYVPFWLLLYHRLDDVRRILPEALRALDLSASQSVDAFLQDLVAFTFSSSQTHWSGLAAGWLEAGLPVNERIAEAVDRMVEEKWASQPVRHRAFRMVARWKKDSAGAV